MDGMDPRLVQQMMDRGELPTFKKFAARGAFSKLQTTTPPQSPVAWASFITGADPGVHGIFDFIHRDPGSFTPYLSTSRTFEAAGLLGFGSSPEVKLMRRGVAVWDALAAAGIPSTVIQIPSNYPVYSESKLVHSISGMGTPDLLGTYGTFTMFTDKPKPRQAHGREGRWVSVRHENNIVETALEGPANPFSGDEKPVQLPVRIERDSSEKILRVSIGGERVILREGEWSKWIPVSFPMIRYLASTRGMVRFYAKEIHPGFALYCSPINADPLKSELPISAPPEYVAELAESTDRFYTQGFPADTKALSTGAFTSEEFYHQSRLAFNESLVNFEKTFSQFTEGFYFFYFSSLDQSSHMLWRMMNPQHPLYEPDAAPEVKNAITSYYKEMDFVLSRALEKEDPRTLVIAMSDHGFANFTREFNVSSWLVKEGLTNLTAERDLGNMDAAPYSTVDWKNSKAYVCGINGIYINRRGRDKFGCVEDSNAQPIIDEIIVKLKDVVDKKTGEKVIVDAYDSRKIYTSPDQQIVPDIIIGYREGYRISDEAVLGKFPREVFTDRTDPWSADHCVDPSVVPGMLFTNRTLTSNTPRIWDLAPSILQSFGVSVPKEMTGKGVIKV
jgi:predicted AlkP superfamily phosphohydrolase/phosphomutase